MHFPIKRLRHRRRSRGQSLVEFALIVPVMLLLLLTAIDLGRLMYSQIVVTNAAKEGALVASQGGTFQSNQGCSDTNTVMCGVLTEADGGFVEVDQARVALNPAVCEKNAMYPSSGAPPNVEVEVRAPFRVLTPVISQFLGSNVILTGTAEAQCLVVPEVTFPSLPEPVAAFTATPSFGEVPLTVSFDASSSTAPNSSIVSYEWSFGATGVTASRTYAAAGTYSVTLTVTNAQGQTDTETHTVGVTSPGAPPCASVVVAFTAVDDSNRGNPHRMDMTGSVSPTSAGWNWVWSGAASGTGQSLNNFNFPSSGPHVVTLTVDKAGCSYTVTQTVTAP